MTRHSPPRPHSAGPEIATPAGGDPALPPAAAQRLDRLVRLVFYQAVFGWASQSWGGDYFLVGDEHAGGITHSQPGLPAHWMIYVNSPDTDATVAQVTELGGTVLLPAREMGEVGRFAVFADPTGGVFAVMQTRRR